MRLYPAFVVASVISVFIVGPLGATVVGNYFCELNLRQVLVGFSGVARSSHTGSICRDTGGFSPWVDVNHLIRGAVPCARNVAGSGWPVQEADRAADFDCDCRVCNWLRCARSWADQQSACALRYKGGARFGLDGLVRGVVPDGKLFLCIPKPHSIHVTGPRPCGGRAGRFAVPCRLVAAGRPAGRCIHRLRPGVHAGKIASPEPHTA